MAGCPATGQNCYVGLIPSCICRQQKNKTWCNLAPNKGFAGCAVLSPPGMSTSEIQGDSKPQGRLLGLFFFFFQMSSALSMNHSLLTFPALALLPQPNGTNKSLWVKKRNVLRLSSKVHGSSQLWALISGCWIASHSNTLPCLIGNNIRRAICTPEFVPF